MTDGASTAQVENTQQNGSTVSQMTPEQQAQYLTTLATTNPAAFAQFVQNFIPPQGNGAQLPSNVTQTSGPPSLGPLGNFAGAIPQAVNAPYPQLPQQPVGASPSNSNAPAGMSFAADLARLNYATAIPGSRDYDVVVASRLREADRDGKSYKDALREMHGVRLWYISYTQCKLMLHRFLTFPPTCG